MSLARVHPGALNRVFSSLYDAGADHTGALTWDDSNLYAIFKVSSTATGGNAILTTKPVRIASYSGGEIGVHGSSVQTDNCIGLPMVSATYDANNPKYIWVLIKGLCDSTVSAFANTLSITTGDALNVYSSGTVSNDGTGRDFCVFLLTTLGANTITPVDLKASYIYVNSR